jgi:hypothetical protein
MDPREHCYLGNRRDGGDEAQFRVVRYQIG